MTQSPLEVVDMQDVEIDVEHNLPNVGRYVLHRQIARGGMATIHIARLMGDEGFSRIVAAKRLLPELAEDSDFVAMFLDEARIASKCHHRNVVPVLDVVTTQDEVLLVQEFVHGAPLHYLLNKARAAKERVPMRIAVSIASQILAGLHAAHEMVDEMGTPLNVVHRDVSPQNVMIAVDGTARLLDFGVAKATMAAHTTREGHYKGKLAYSAPEQLNGKATRQSDLYSLAILLWELLVGHRMHGSQSEAELVSAIMTGNLPTITETLGAEHEWDAIDDATWQQLSAIEPIVRKGLVVDIASRWKDAVEMEEALVKAVPPATTAEVAAWLKKHGSDYLEKHDKAIATEEASWRRKQTYPGTGSRRTPFPGLRMADGSKNASIPPAPHRRGPYILITILAMLVGGLAIGVVFLMRDGAKSATASPTPAAATPTPTPTAPTPTTPTPTPMAVEPKAEPAAAPVAEPVADERPAEPIAAPTEGTEPIEEAAKAAPAPARTVKKPAVRTQPQPKTPVRAAKPADVTPTPAPAPAGSAKPDNCSPPYYFEGTKKIFKPQCL